MAQQKNMEEKEEKKDPEATALVNILEDFEEARRRAEQERAKTEAIITNFTEGLLVFDPDSRLSLINPQAESLLMVTKGEVVGKSVLELSAISNLEQLIILLGMDIKSFFRKELEVREDFVLEISSIPILREGEKLGTLVILHDVTREKLIERMKTEFVSIAAHQLRTPLSAIKWTLRMLLDGDLGKITKEQRSFVEKTYKSNERMISLINDLLNVTRIEEGRYLYKPSMASIENVIQFIINSLKDEIEKKNLKFKFNRPKEEIHNVKIDVEKVRLAIQNILENAIRYTPPGGEIIISLKHETTKDLIELSVKDSGVGIPQDQQERVFSKFFRGANVIRMETEGSGLGLFITKNIIEAHGGRIWFESKEGVGTTFYLTLPIKK